MSCPAFRNDELGNTASELVTSWLREQFNQNKRLREYLTPENLEALQALVRNNLPTTLWLVFNWLRQPEISEKLVQIGQDLFRRGGQPARPGDPGPS